MKAGLRIEETQTNKITEIFLAAVVTTVYYGVVNVGYTKRYNKEMSSIYFWQEYLMRGKGTHTCLFVKSGNL